MKILVIGASRGTGALAVEAALAAGHQVTAFARSPDKLTVQHANLKRVAGSFHDAKAVAAAIPGHDAVIITASATSMKSFQDEPRYFSLGTEHAITAMRGAGVRRLVVLSALGTNDSAPLLPFIFRLIGPKLLLKLPFADHERQEQMVKASGLDWVIARPPRLTNGPAKKAYKKTAALEKVPNSISRADVADFLVEAATSPAWLKKSVQIGG